MTSYPSVFGLVTGRDDVTQAALSTLRTWIISAIAEVERQARQLPRSIPIPGSPSAGFVYRPDEGSFRGGLDWETWQADNLPLLIAIVQPTGDAERDSDEYSENVYTQTYMLEVGAVCEAQDEQTATQLADWYGKAIKLAIGQHGGLGTRLAPDGVTVVPFAEKTVLVSDARTEFFEDAPRSLVRSIVSFHTVVEHVMQEAGPQVVPADPYAVPQDWPTVTTVEVQLQSQTPAGVTVAADGVTVTDSTGHVLVTE